VAAVAPTVSDPAAVSHGGFRPARAGIVARVIVSVLIAAAVLIQPALWDVTQDHWIAKAAIFAIIGLSVNVITGHAGQISLGHQAFVGIGAFLSAFVISKLGGFFPSATNLVLPPTTVSTTDFWFGITAAGLIGAAMALILGMAALRIRGLYLALITLAFGLLAENSIFNWRPFTGGGAGLPAPRPVLFESEQAYAYLCLAFMGLFLFVDWRLVRSRGGRAIVALRNDERVAATLGVNVTRYKLLAFATSGLMAGVAGALFAHWNQAVQALDFVLQTALVWILMAVVGGLGSRAGVVIGSVFFALFDLVIGDLAGDASITLSNELAATVVVAVVLAGAALASAPLLRRAGLPRAASLAIPMAAGVGLFFLIGRIFEISGEQEILVQILTPFLGALLLLLTITLYPGGIGEQILPIRRWLSGGLLVDSKHEAVQLPGLPALAAGVAAGVIAGGTGWVRWAIGAGVFAAVLVALAFLLLLYLRRAERTARRAAPPAPMGEPKRAIPVPEAGSGAEPDTGSAAPEAGDLTHPVPQDATRGSSVPPVTSGGRTSRFSGLHRKRDGS
jgi:branched-chain amino acid transport system permease protein